MANSNVDDSIGINHDSVSSVNLEEGINRNVVFIAINHDYHHVASVNNTIELTSVNDVPIEMKPGHVSLNNTYEMTNANVPSEMNHSHHHVASVNNTVEMRNAIGIPIEINPGHVASVNNTGEMTNANVPIEIDPLQYLTVTNMETKEQYEINHVHYRFAYDLVETVLEIRGELKPDVPHNLPDPPYYLFTEEHKATIENLLETRYRDTTNLIREIYRLTNGKYEYQDYLICRDYFVLYWQKGVYTEKSFIRACAVIAYTAAHFIQVNVECGSLDNAVEYIAKWVAVILGRGKLDQSRW